MQQLLLTLQKWLVPRQKWLKLAFWVAELLVIAIWALGVVAFVFLPYQEPANLQLHLALYEWGARFGVLALGCYILTLLPGIISRLRWQPVLGAMLMPYRRHAGILMFLFVFAHMSFTTSLPGVLGGLGLTINTPKLFGLLAMMVLFPLWLTSNDPSQRYLGKKWKFLHRLTYIALLMIFMHLAFFRKRWAIPTFGILGLEAVSWLVVWWRGRQVPPTSPTAT